MVEATLEFVLLRYPPQRTRAARAAACAVAATNADAEANDNPATGAARLPVDAALIAVETVAAAAVRPPWICA